MFKINQSSPSKMYIASFLSLCVVMACSDSDPQAGESSTTEGSESLSPSEESDEGKSSPPPNDSGDGSTSSTATTSTGEDESGTASSSDTSSTTTSSDSSSTTASSSTASSTSTSDTSTDTTTGDDDSGDTETGTTGDETETTGDESGTDTSTGDDSTGSTGTDSGDEGSTGTTTGDDDPMPWFTFFMTSQEGILSLSSDKVNGLGGDLGGLAGADEICTKLAKVGNPGDTKKWVAFLSTTKGGPNDGPIHAIERVGKGPWHDFNKRVFAEDVAGLLPTSDKEGRPSGADPQLAEMFTDEKGRVISTDTKKIDNHDTLTGSGKDGRLPDDATYGSTCSDWTSKDPDANERPIIGHAWPRSSNNGRHWISDHRAGGCGAGINISPGGGGGKTVGSGGGYGGFYCFAVAE